MIFQKVNKIEIRNNRDTGAHQLMKFDAVEVYFHIIKPIILIKLAVYEAYES